MDDMFLLMQKLNCFCQLQKNELRNFLYLILLLRISANLVQDAVENDIVLDVELLFVVPGGDLAHVGQLEDQVDVVVVVGVDELEELDDVFVVELGPDLDFIVDFVEVVYHEHLAAFVVS